MLLVFNITFWFARGFVQIYSNKKNAWPTSLPTWSDLEISPKLVVSNLDPTPTVWTWVCVKNIYDFLIGLALINTVEWNFFHAEQNTATEWVEIPQCSYQLKFKQLMHIRFLLFSLVFRSVEQLVLFSFLLEFFLVNCKSIFNLSFAANFFIDNERNWGYNSSFHRFFLFQ